MLKNVIKELVKNDKNSIWQEIAEEGVDAVKACLQRMIEDEGLEGDELEFYKRQYNRL